MAKIKDLDVQEKSSTLGPESGLWIFHFGVWICKSWQGFAVYIICFSLFFSLAGARSPLCTPTPIGGLWPACMFCFVMLAGCLFCRSTHIQAKVPHPQCGGGALGFPRPCKKEFPVEIGFGFVITPVNCHRDHHKLMEEIMPFVIELMSEGPGWFAPTFPHSMFLKLLLGNMFVMYIYYIWYIYNMYICMYSI